MINIANTQKKLKLIYIDEASEHPEKGSTPALYPTGYSKTKPNDSDVNLPNIIYDPSGDFLISFSEKDKLNMAGVKFEDFGDCYLTQTKNPENILKKLKVDFNAGDLDKLKKG